MIDITTCDGKYNWKLYDSSKFECYRYGDFWRNFRGDKAVLSLVQELEEARNTIAKLEKENCELGQNVCGECSPDDYGWIYNRVEGKVVCGCILESEPFQILLNALEKLACLGNGDRLGNSQGNVIAIEALRKVLPLDYEVGVSNPLETIA